MGVAARLAAEDCRADQLRCKWNANERRGEALPEIRASSALQLLNAIQRSLGAVRLGSQTCVVQARLLRDFVSFQLFAAILDGDIASRCIRVGNCPPMVSLLVQ